MSQQVTIVSDVLWRNYFGEPVNLDDIDRRYAENILANAVAQCERRGWSKARIEALPLVQKLRQVIPVAREATEEDLRREREYNFRVLEANRPELLIDQR
jgi:hypothetical protein